MRISEQGGARSPEAKRSEESIVVSKAPEDWPTSRRCRVLERAAPCARSWSAPVLRRFGADNFGARRLVLLGLALGPILTQGSSAQINPAPYPPSPFFQSITWHWDTHQAAAPGSDLWPVTWADDDTLYTAWGDGGGFGGTDQDGRVALGFGRIEGGPEQFRGINLNGGKDPQNAAAFPKRGKAGGILASKGVLYAWINRQNGTWPNVDEGLAWSTNKAKIWENSSWAFSAGKDKFKPSTFLNFGQDYTDLPAPLRGFIYFYGVRQGDEHNVFMGRAPVESLRTRSTYEFLTDLSEKGPVWSTNSDHLHPIFTDPNGVTDLPTVIYHPASKRFLLTIFHKGPGQLGIFDARQPWGTWTTIAYYEKWGDMGTEGHGLTCSFPQKWMSADGLTLWCIFSVYGEGAKQGARAHDQFNLLKATVTLR